MKKLFSFLFSLLFLLILSGCGGDTDKVPSHLPFPRLLIKCHLSSSAMNPNHPQALGVVDLSSTAFETIQDTPTITYEWSVMDVGNHSGFGNDQDAINDIYFSDKTLLNPVLHVSTPQHWENGSFALLKLTCFYLGQKNDSARYLATFHDGTVSLILVPDENVMDPFVPDYLGVERFYCIGSDVTNLTPGVTYDWNAVDAFGYQGFVSKSAALADLGFVQKNVLNPFVTIKTPQNWPNGSSVVYQCTIHHAEIGSHHPSFLLIFEHGDDNLLVLHPSTKTMSPYRPEELGVQSFTNYHGQLTENTPGLTYQWEVVSAAGYEGFANQNLAVADIGFVNSKLLNPHLTVATPENWPDYSDVLLKVTVVWDGVLTYHGNFVVTFIDPWPNLELPPIYVLMDPFDPTNLGNEGWNIEGFEILPGRPGIAYKWEVIDELGHQGSHGITDVTCVDDEVLDPSLLVASPGLWPNGSMVIMKCTIDYHGRVNDTARAFVEFRHGEGSDDYLALYPNFQYMDPYQTEQLGVIGFVTQNNEITPSTPGLTYKWEIESVSDYLGFGSDALAMQDLSLSSSTIFKPVLNVNTPDNWPNGSRVHLKLAIGYGPKTYWGDFTVQFVVSGEPHLHINPVSKFQSPSVTEALGTTATNQHHSVVTEDTPDTTFLWSVFSVGGYTGFGSDGAAIADINLTNVNKSNPTLGVSTPGNWPNGSTVVLKCAWTYEGESSDAFRFTVTWTVAPILPTSVTIVPSSKTQNPNDVEATGTTATNNFSVSVDHTSPGLTFAWYKDSASGYTGFGTEAAALANVNLTNIGRVAPTVGVSTPGNWPNGSQVVLGVVVTYNGVITDTFKFTINWVTPYVPPVGFVDEWILIEGGALPYQYGDGVLGVLGLDISGFRSEITGIKDTTPGVNFWWTVDRVFGYMNLGYATEEDAINDLVIHDLDSLCPFISELGGENFNVVFRLHVTYGGITNSNGLVLLSADPGSMAMKWLEYGTASVDSYKNPSLDPRITQDIGVTSIHIMSGDGSAYFDDLLNGSETYKWRVVHAENFVGFVSVSDAISDVVISGDITNNPSIGVNTSDNWPTNSFVTLRLEIEFEGENYFNDYNVYFENITHDYNFDNDFDIYNLLSASHTIEFSEILEDWSVPIVLSDPSYSWEWQVINIFDEHGFKSDVEAKNNIVFNNRNLLKPTLTFNQIEKWRDNSIELQLVIKQSGVIIGSCMYFVLLEKDGFDISVSTDLFDTYEVNYLIDVDPDLFIDGSIIDKSDPGITAWKWSFEGLYHYSIFGKLKHFWASEFQNCTEIINSTTFNPSLRFHISDKTDFHSEGAVAVWLKCEIVYLGKKYEQFVSVGNLALDPMYITVLGFDSVFDPNYFNHVVADDIVMDIPGGGQYSKNDGDITVEWQIRQIRSSLHGDRIKARDDIDFLKNTEVNPWVYFKTPDLWPNDSEFDFRIIAKRGSIKRETYLTSKIHKLSDFQKSTVVFENENLRSEGQINVVVDLDFGGFSCSHSPVNNSTPGVMYYWGIKEIVGHDFANDMVARSNVSLTNANSLNPSIRIHDFGLLGGWVDGTGFVLECYIEYDGESVYTEPVTYVLMDTFEGFNEIEISIPDNVFYFDPVLAPGTISLDNITCSELYYGDVFNLYSPGGKTFGIEFVVKDVYGHSGPNDAAAKASVIITGGKTFNSFPMASPHNLHVSFMPGTNYYWDSGSSIVLGMRMTVEGSGGKLYVNESGYIILYFDGTHDFDSFETESIQFNADIGLGLGIPPTPPGMFFNEYTVASFSELGFKSSEREDSEYYYHVISGGEAIQNVKITLGDGRVLNEYQGLEFEWYLKSVSGYRWFSDDTQAKSSIVLTSIRHLCPGVHLINPGVLVGAGYPPGRDFWPHGAEIVLGCRIRYLGGVNENGEFTIKFRDPVNFSSGYVFTYGVIEPGKTGVISTISEGVNNFPLAWGWYWNNSEQYQDTCLVGPRSVLIHGLKYSLSDSYSHRRHEMSNYRYPAILGGEHTSWGHVGEVPRLSYYYPANHMTSMITWDYEIIEVVGHEFVDVDGVQDDTAAMNSLVTWRDSNMDADGKIAFWCKAVGGHTRWPHGSYFIYRITFYHAGQVMTHDFKCIFSNTIS